MKTQINKKNQFIYINYDLLSYKKLINFNLISSFLLEILNKNLDDEIDSSKLSSVEIVEFTLLPESFLGFSSILISIFISTLVYNKKYSFINLQLVFTAICSFLIILTFIILLNDNLLLFKQVCLNTFTFYAYLTILAKCIILILSCLSLLIIVDYTLISKINNVEYQLIIVYAVLGLILLVTAHDLLSLFITLELQALSLYILAAFKKNSVYSIESGLKYFIIGAFSSGLILFGTSFMYGLTGIVSFLQFNLLFF